MTQFRKRPIEIPAVQWTGSNEAELHDFAAGEFAKLDDQDRAHCDDPDATAQVYDVLHSTWVPVQTNDWILRGIRGEFYPCRADVFEVTYERVEHDD